MNRLTAFFKRTQLRQILTAFLAGVLLIVSTACSGATTQAANPKNDAMMASETNRKSEILYPGAETPEGRAQKEAKLPIKTEQDFVTPAPGAGNQRQGDLGQRIGNRIGTVKEEVKEASKFLKEKSDEAGARPELKSNPAVQ